MTYITRPVPQPTPGLSRRLRAALRHVRALPGAAWARSVEHTAKARRFSGAFNTREAAEATVARRGGKGYDDDTITDVSFELMCRCASWDYPVLFWLQRLLPAADTVIDAGGHFGTKYIAFRNLIDLSATQWCVYDLPSIVHAAIRRQANGEVPTAISFYTDPLALPAADVLLCSGLLQYQDVAFPDFVSSIPVRPQHILLNKVALRDGSELHTIERIGDGCVPYRIRNRAIFEAQIDKMGYDIVDSWNIPDLSHIIPTHPWLGPSESRGYALRSSSRPI